MATPTGEVWDRDPHTGAKHDLLRRYFAAWLPILFTNHPRLTYVEGFAGPGVYTRNEPGSPVVALEVLASHRGLLAAHPERAVDVVFVEEDERRHSRLERELAVATARLGEPPRNVTVHPPVRADCAEAVPALLADIGAWGSPMLVILDSWGGPDVPFDLLRRVARNPSGEAWVTFGSSFLTRHGKDPQHAESGDAAFGGKQWRGVFDQPSDKKWAYLVEAYRATLLRAGFKFTLGFEMVDERGAQLWLMFGTNSPKGLEKMKDAMWAVDPAYGVRYRDPRDPNQMALDIEQEPDTSALERMLLDVLTAGPRTLDALRQHALYETVYRPQQVRGVVQRLAAAGKVQRGAAGQMNGATMLSVAPNGARDDGEQLSFNV
jgi:three-Cys-motif partner protein